MNVGMEIDGVRTAPADAWVISGSRAEWFWRSF